MDKDFLNEFVYKIECLSKVMTKDDAIVDQYGIHQKATVLDHYVCVAKDLIRHGEYLIALENMLDNLIDSSIYLDESIIRLARQAFGDKITKEYELILEKVSK